MKNIILIVDDEQEIREILKSILEREKHIVLTASNGEEALEISQSIKIDIVIIDLLMAKMNGLEFLKQAKRNFKVITLSALSEVMAPELESLKVDFSFSKPFNSLLIVEAVNYLLDLPPPIE